MRAWRNWASAVGAAALLVLLGAVPLSAQPPGFPPDCDQYDPFSPAGHTRITLGPTDFTGSHHDQMRSFIETGSIGRVDARIVSAPPGAVIAMSAIPEISRNSPYYGEALNGIALGVAFRPGARPSRIVLDVRQVCARHFRNTFLYY